MGTQYYPGPIGGAYTGFIPGGNPYVPGGGYSTGDPAGYGMPLPPHFSSNPDTSWLTPPEDQFERRHLDQQIDATDNEWAIAGAVLGGLMIVAFVANTFKLL